MNEELENIPDIDRSGLYEIDTINGLTAFFRIAIDVEQRVFDVDFYSSPIVESRVRHISVHLIRIIDDDGNVSLSKNVETDMENQLEQHLVNQFTS